MRVEAPDVRQTSASCSDLLKKEFYTKKTIKKTCPSNWRLSGGHQAPRLAIRPPTTVISAPLKTVTKCGRARARIPHTRARVYTCQMSIPHKNSFIASQKLNRQSPPRPPGRHFLSAEAHRASTHICTIGRVRACSF